MKKIAITTILLLAIINLIYAQGFFDGFESYNVGEQLVQQNPVDWSTWNSTPGSEQDPFINSNIGGNVVHVSGQNDFVYDVPNYTVGFHQITFDLYIPSGGDAYFNTLQEYSPTPSWGMQVYFGHYNTGEGNIDGGAALAQIFTFQYDAWLQVKVEIDLDNDWAEFFLDNNMIHDWVWSTGTFGTGTLNQLGGNNFYAWGDGVNANPDFYIDNYCFDCNPGTLYPPQNLTAFVVNQDDVHLTWDTPVSGDPIGYEAYRDGNSIGFYTTTETYDYDLYPGSYQYYVRAYYSLGLSVPSNIVEVTLPSPIPPPENLSLLIENNDVTLTWDPSGGCGPGGEWIQWDDGTNEGNGVGLTNGGTFYVASHWLPEDLIYYDSMMITQIAFFPNEDENASFVIMAWTGENAGTLILSQPVDEYIVNQMNYVTLTTPIMIDASTELWFGYEVTHEPATFPAGCDYGPAIATKGDMISLDGVEWVSMSLEYFMDYNWNLAAYIEELEGEKIVNIPLQKKLKATTQFSGFAESPKTGFKTAKKEFSPSATEDFLYYKIYRNYDSIGITTDTMYFDQNLNSGTYNYCVSAVCDEGESSLACADEIQIEFGFPPQNISAVLINPTTALLTWDMPPDVNHLGYNIYSNNSFVDFIPYGENLQYEFANLSTGSYIFCVSIIYAEGESILGCANEIITKPTNIPRNVHASVTKLNEVHLTWKEPVDGEPMFYNVWRNGEIISPVSGTTTLYFDSGLWSGNFLYCVSAIYENSESQLACAEEISIYIFIPPPPMNLTGSQYIVPWEPVYLSWDAPWLGLWHRWDAGTNTGNGIGLTNGGTFSCASHWFPENLSGFDGFNLTDIQFYANSDAAATYVIKVWIGPDGANEVVSQVVPGFNVDDWNTVTLTSPHTINAAEDLWFGYEITHEGSTFPAGCDDGPAIQYNGDMISTGGEWVSMSADYGLDYNWNIAGYFDLSDSLSGFEHYNIYRKDPGVSYFDIIGTSTETIYYDYADEIGLLTYYVTSVWDPGGESIPSNEWEVDVLTVIDNRKMKISQIYPNPSSDIVIIESESEIVSLNVYNPTGQIIIEEEVNKNIYKLDVSHLNPGIYFLQIEFKDETILKKIIVE